MAKGIQELTAKEALCVQLGLAGMDRIADTSTHEDDWAFFIVESAATMDAGCAVETGDAPASGDTFAQGEVVYGPFTALQLSAGTIYAYRR